MRSAAMTVDSLCAITNVVRPAMTVSKAACTASSDFESRAAQHSTLVVTLELHISNWPIRMMHLPVVPVIGGYQK